MSQAFICPITSIVMQDPYMDANGISYQKQAIFKWVRKEGRHPTAGRQMKLQQLNANLMLKDVINQYKQKFKDRVNYQISRDKFEVDRLNFEAATKLQMSLLEQTPGFEDSERKYKTTIKELQQMVQIKQIKLQSLRKNAAQNSRKLQEQILQIKVLQEALKKSKQRENEMRNKLKQRQQELQYLSQKSRTLESENQILKNNLLDQLALQTGQKQMLKQELLIAQFKQKGGQQKIERQPQIEKPKIRQILEQPQRKKRKIRQFEKQPQLEKPKIRQQAAQLKYELMRIQINPDKQSRGFKEKNWILGNTKSNIWGWILGNTNSNVCIRNTEEYSNWLCSSAVPFDGEFLFTIKVIKLMGGIDIGVMEEGKKGEKWIGDTRNYSVYLDTYYQYIYRPNEEQTKHQSIECSCSSQLPQCPFQIECHVNRQQNTIAWHYDGKQQAKSILPKTWKTNKKQLCAIFWVPYEGDSVQMM